MPSIPCPNLEICPGTDSPLGNFSSEAPDPPSFFRLNFPWLDSNNPVGGNGGGNLPPPSFFAGGCATICESQISQEDANLCAARAAYICAHSGGPNGPTTQFFYSTLQVCNINCPDGSVFAYRVFPGAFVATSQAQADQQAAAYACQQAGVAVLCMSSMPTAGCLSTPYVGIITSVARGLPPFTFSLISGELPPGLTLTQVSAVAATVTGSPTTPGNYAFGVQLTDARGNFTQRTYAVAVLAIVNSPAQATQAQAYVFNFGTTGGTGPYTYFLASGSLPTGLSLLSDGTLTGTPTEAGTFPFNVSVTDSTGASCTTATSITSAATACVADTGPAVPASWSDPQPAGLIITDFDASVFNGFGGCPAGGATDNFNGRLPIRSAPDAFTQKYWPAGLAPGTSPHLIQTAGAQVEAGFVPSDHWYLNILCSTGGASIWQGWKTVGDTPAGTYLRMPGGSSTKPDCLHLAEQLFDWSSMVWVPTLVQPNGTAAASGAGGTFAVSATANAAVTNFGQILGTMTYSGPVCSARLRITVTGADTGGFSSFRFRVNGITIGPTPAVGFSVGVTDHYFTIYNPASPGDPLVGATLEVRAIAQTDVVGNSPAYSGILS